ncbi:MAG TPA: histidine kinase [Steroidobacteraceae bacterium]|nr:histidine kinase [Steroidobacteraceae bacterium]
MSRSQARNDDTPGRTGLARRGALAFAFWTAVGFVFALPGLGSGTSVARVVASALAQWWSWGLIAPAIIAFDRALPFSAGQFGKRVATHLLIGPAVTVVYGYLLCFARCLMGLDGWSVLAGTAVPAAAGREIFWSMLVYCMIVGAWQAYSYKRRYVLAELQLERMERTASEARLHALRTQLDPHFLFNTLNAVSSQVERDPGLARAMIEQLGDLLRLSLDSHGKQSIRLRDELAFTSRYLALQKIRFGDRLQIEVEVAADAADVFVPSLVLQPLVENAIRHGLSSRPQGGVLQVSARRSDQHLVLRVEDDGVGLAPGWSLEEDSGIGLRLTRERLAVRFPDSGSRFEISPRASGGTVVSIALPWRTTEEAGEYAAG